MLAAFLSLVLTPAASATTCGDGTSPDRREDYKVGDWAIHVDASSECRGGARVDLVATRKDPAESVGGTASGGGAGGGANVASSGGFLSIPIYCRRDDYMFLPPQALGGIPCLSFSQDTAFDPQPLAAGLAATLPPPDLRIRMNPDKGMVRVPTWFWVEGYDGGTIGASQQVLQEHTTCHLVAIRDDTGQVVLDANGTPRTKQQCNTEDTTFNVEVRLWPQNFAWDFGDQSSPHTITCGGIGDCPDALGAPFLDALHASSIQHPYIWSSLSSSGGADAYVVTLAITFAADYRVSVNGQQQGGWRSLPSRTLSWTANHEVQEAQAVLVRPCPVTVARC